MHIAFVKSCKSDSHLATSDIAECDSFCQQKVIDSDGMATVAPELYDFESFQCCRCNYERIKAPDPPDEETNGGDNTDVPSYDLFPELTPGDIPLPSLPVPPKAPELDPSTFKPPTEKELQDATDPNFVPQPKTGQRMNYAVILVKGMPWELPLSKDIVTAFVYAFNNITGKPWQYKGAMVSVLCQVKCDFPFFFLGRLDSHCNLGFCSCSHQLQGYCLLLLLAFRHCIPKEWKLPRLHPHLWSRK